MSGFIRSRRIALCAGVGFALLCGNAWAQSPDQQSTLGSAVPATLAVTLAPVSFGNFQPGVARDYLASTTATVTSSAGNAALIVQDTSPFYTNHLVNGSSALSQELQVKNNFGNYQTMPAGLRFWSGPTAGEAVPVELKQSITANEPLRTGSYTKSLVFTLSTTEP
jgi:hypothetical protein